MIEDIKALRDALNEHVTFFASPRTFSYATEPWHAACSPDRIARLLDALEAAQKDAARYRWLRAMDITHEWGVVNGDMSEAPVLDELDAAIDSAMAGGQ